MHVSTTRRKYNGKGGERVYETHLLRRTFREEGKVKHETLANLSHLPVETIELVRRSLGGESFVGVDDVEVTRSLPHGAGAAVAVAANKLGLAKLLGPACRQRDLVFALVVSRVCEPASKLATSRWWSDTTIGADLGVGDASSDDVYAAMDWLVERQGPIEQALADRHLGNDAIAMFDLSSSWVEGTHCPLAARGYSRDGKAGREQIEYGLLCDRDGRPVAVEVFEGNTADPTAFCSAVKTVTDRFGLSKVVMVGDRGMITSARIDAMRANTDLGWITALRAPAIAKLAGEGPLQMSLFDETNLAEITHPDYAGERLVACRNPALAAQRTRKRDELLAATETELDKIVAAVAAGRLVDAAKIGERVGRNANRYKMAKHFDFDIDHGHFAYQPKTDQIDAEAALDGIYVIRTSVPASDLDTAEVVEAYKDLSKVEANFRSLKAIDLDLRPIHHHLENRVRAHVLLCMLAAYIVWHLRQWWAPLCFTDEEPTTRTDPVAAAHRSNEADHKASTRTTATGETAHSFATLLNHLSTLCRNTIALPGGHQIDKLTQPTDLQRQAFQLLERPIPLTITAK